MTWDLAEGIDRGRSGECHEDFSDAPVRCSGCGLYGSPDDGDYVSTSRGPVCKHCFDNGEAAS